MKISTRTNLFLSSLLFFTLCICSSAFAQEPTVQAHDITFSNLNETTYTIDWTNGDGTQRLVVGNATGPVSFTPADGTAYTYTGDGTTVNFSTATDLGGGNKVVYVGAGTTQNLTGLTNTTVYNFRVFEFTGATTTTDYLTATGTNNPNSRTTLAVVPTASPTAMTFGSITGASVSVGFTAASGAPAGYIALMGTADPTDAPANGLVDGSTYTVGQTVGDGKVVYIGSSSPFPVTGLNGSTQYFFDIYSYNGSGATINYRATGGPLEGSTTTTALAAEATVQAKDIVFSAIGQGTLTLNWTAGTGGTERLVVAHASTPITQDPVDGTAYANAAGNFSTGTDLGGGNKVIYRGATNSVTVTNLTPGITYYFKVYEVSGTTTSTNYLTSDGASGNPANKASLATVPTNQPTAMTFSSIASTSMTVGFTAAVGTPDGYIVVMGAGSNPTNAAVTDGVTYAVGDPLGGGTVAYIGDASTFSFPLSGLTANIVYNFDIYSFNGSGGTINYLTTGGPLESSRSTLAATKPTTASTALAFSNVQGTTLTLGVTVPGAGGGTSRLVVAREGAAVTFSPVDGVSYTAGGFTAGTEVGPVGDGNKIVASGTNAFAITGLVADKTYHFAVFEFNGTGGSGAENYFTTALTGSQQTEPATQASSPVFSSVTTTSMTLSWTSGDGDRRLVIARQGSAVATDPTDNTGTYAANNDWNNNTPSGTPIGAGFVVYDGTGSSVTLNNLVAGTTYHFAVYEYNGGSVSSALYKTPGLTANRTTVPSQATNVLLSSGGTATTQMDIAWTNGNGTARIVLMKMDPAFVWTPVNNTTYSAAANFSNATGDLDPDATNIAKVIFVGTGSSINDFANLTANTSYTVEVFEYNGAAGSEQYNTATATGNPATRSTRHATNPGTAGTNMNFTPVGETTMTVTMNGGSGSGTMLIARAGTNAVSFTPTDGTSYTVNTDFGAGAEVGPVGDGNKIVGISTATNPSFNVVGLTGDTEYRFSAVEFNGTAGTGAENYGSALTGNRNTEPTAPASNLSVTQLTDASNCRLTLDWTGSTGNGDRRLIAIKAGTMVAADEPVDYTSYASANTVYAAGTVVGSGGSAYSVFSNTTGTSVTVTGLTPSTVYQFAVYEGNSLTSANAGGNTSANAVWLTPGTTISKITLAVPPTTQATSVTTGTAGSSSIANIGWTKGNGTGGRILLVKPTSTFVLADVPTSGTSVSYAGLDYSAGTPFGPNGSRVVYVEGAAGTGGTTKVTVTGLSPSTTYFFAVVEFNGTAGLGDENYLTTAGTGNPASKSTISNTQPSTQASNLNFVGTGNSTTLNLKWTNGNATGGRIVVINTVPITATDNPSNGTTYTGNLAFGSAPSIGSGTAKVVYDEVAAGTGGTSGITITGLTQNTTYYFKVFEFGGSAGTENFQTADGTNNPVNTTTATQPTATYNVSAGTLASANVAANITITFNVAMRFVNNSAITTDANIKTFVHLEDNTTASPISFTSSISGNVISIVPADSNIPGNKLTGSRDYKVTIDNNEIETSADVPLPTSNQVVVAETLAAPSNQAVASTTSSTTTSVTLNWLDASVGQLPENYLVVGIENGGSFPTISNGTLPSIDTDLSDGTYIQKVAYGVQTITASTGLKSGVQYLFRIYAYTNEESAITYNLTSPTTFSVSTTVGSLTTVSAGTGVSTLSSLTDTKTEAIAVADASANFAFTITDDGANNAIDNAPTRISSLTIKRHGNDETGGWTNAIAGVVFTDGTTTINTTDNAANISFADGVITVTGMANSSASDLGYVADGTPKTYYVKVWLKNNITALDIDKKHVVFSLVNTDINPAAVNSSAFASSSTNSGTGKNTVDVTATKIIFTQIPPNATGAGFAFDLSIAATDANNNVDLDEDGTGSTMRLGSSYLSTPPAGTISFGAETQDHDLALGRTTWFNLKVTKAGDYQFTIDDQDTGPTDLTPSLATSTTVTFGPPSAESVIAENGFASPADIDYRSYQQSVTLVGPVTNSIKVAEFIIGDGGFDIVDGDAIGTTLTDLTFTITNAGNIRLVGIHDGTSIIASQAPSGGAVTFSGLSLLAEDIDNSGTGFKIFSVYVSFNATVTDNEHFEFKISSATSTGSTFAATNAGGAQSSTNTSENNVVVSPSQLRFIQGPTNTDIGVAMSPTVSVEVTDNFGSRDLDFGGTATILSSGVLSAGVSASIANGKGFASSIVHTTKSTNSALIAQLTGLSDATSAFFDVTASSASDIVRNTSFTEPSNIAYATYQSTNIGLVGSDIQVASFQLRDGGATLTDSDNAGTTLKDLTFNIANVAALRRIAIYVNGVEIQEKAGGTSPLTFSGLNISTTDGAPGFKNLDIRVSFNASSATVTDNAQVQFIVAGATTTTTSSDFINTTAGGASSSITLNRNRIEVTASQFVFTSAPVFPYALFANKFITPSLTLEARDANNIKDLDFHNIDVDITNADNIPMSDNAGHSNLTTVTVPFLSGVLTLDNQLRYDHKGSSGNGKLTITDPISGITKASGNITVSVSSASNIIENTLFDYPDNIAYINYLTNNIDPTSAGDEIQIGEFILQDGGGSADADGTSTKLTSLTFDLNTSHIKNLALYAGATELDEVVVSGSTVTFSGFTATAPDDGNLTLKLYASFKDAVTDNDILISKITNSAVDSRYSLLPTGSTGNAGGATTSNPQVNDNKIEVNATTIDYTSIPLSANINTQIFVQAEGRDSKGNRDTDFNGTITAFSNTSAFTVSNGPIVSTSAFAAGVYTFPYNVGIPALGFQFTSGNASTQLQMTAGGISGTSPAISVVTAAESWLYLNFVPFSDIDYINHQETIDPSSFTLGEFILSDGDADGTFGDPDLAPTVLNSFTISITNPANIRRIALYNAAGVLIANTETGGAASVIFSGAAMRAALTAPDDGFVRFTIRASFNNTSANVVDNQVIQLNVTAADIFSGSQFRNDPGFIGGVNGGAITANNVNRIEVSADRLKFVTQPSNALLGIAMSPAVTVEAVDANSIRDLDISNTPSAYIGSISSTGTASAVSVPFVNGLGTASAITHSVLGTNLTLTASLSATPAIASTPVSSTFDITASNQANIVLKAITESTNIPYEDFQAASSLTTANSVELAQFTIQDAGAMPGTDADNAPTSMDGITFVIGNVSALRTVAIFDGSTRIAELPAISPLVFSNLVAGVGITAADDNSKTFSVRATFKNTAANVTDNAQISLTISNATTTNKSSKFNVANAGAAQSSTSGDDNRIEVSTDKFVFTTAPASSIFANIAFAAQIALEARDLNDIVDLDYAEDVNITNQDNIPMTDDLNTSQTTIVMAFASGALQLDDHLRYDIGNADGTLTIEDPISGVTLTSGTIAVKVSSSSDIAEGSFTYPTDIQYINYQETDISLPSDGDEIEIAQFVLRDGGASLSDADGVGTQLTDLQLDLGSNYSFIKQLALYDGNTELDEVTVGSQTVNFSSFSTTAAEGGTKTLRIIASFNNVGIIDRQQIVITVTNATVNSSTSVFSTGSTGDAGGAFTDLGTGTNKNKIQVIATKIDFTTIPASTSISVPFQMVAQARDIHGNTDIDFNGSSTGKITAFSNTSNFTIQNGPVVNTDFFTNGVFNFQYVAGNLNSSLHFTSGNAGTQFVINAGGILDQHSPTISVVSSFDSRLAGDNTYTFSNDINYELYQAGNIDPLDLSTSFEIARFVLHDGDPAKPYPDLAFPGNTLKDQDGAITTLQDFDLEFFTSGTKLPVRSIAIYVGGLEVDEKAPGALTAGKSTTHFTGVNITAADEGQTPISVRVSFLSNSTDIIDNDQITMRISAATEGTGSKFVNTAGYIGGVNGGLQTPATVSGLPVNKVEVTATKFDFIQQPPAFAGINQPVPLVQTPTSIIKVQARDQFDVVDLDYAGIVTISASAGLGNTNGTFTAGTLDLSGLQYTSTGDGTLTVSNALLSSNTNSGPNVSVNCSHVDVIHVSATKATGGVFTGNLGGGAQKKVIFGVTFRAPYTVASEPMIEKFTLSFTTLGSIIGVFNNMKVFESANAAFEPLNDVDVTSYGAKLTVASKALTIDFTQPGGIPRDLRANGGELTYFLMVDVDQSANANTPLIQPRFEDDGVHLSATNDNLVTSEGSGAAYGSLITPTTPAPIVGTNYNFAAVLAPTIVSSFPAVGQLDVDPAQPTIELVFSVPVWTLDGKIKLYDYKTNELIQELTALTGQFAGRTGTRAGTSANPLKFQLPVLEQDHMYYITIAPGKYNGDAATDNEGIMDEFNIVSPGFSYPGTFYFKTSNLKAPKLLTVVDGAPKAPNISNISQTGATINATFDQQGTAYFMVVERITATTPSSEPDNAEINGTLNTYGGIADGATFVTRGNFTIEQTRTIMQFGLINASLTVGKTYDVWIYAESYSSRKEDMTPPVPAVLSPIPTTRPYGSNFVEGSGTATLAPTLTFTPSAPPAGTGPIIFAPTLLFCSDSYQTLNAPIVIVERNNNDFDTQGVRKSFNLLLPPGFQFDDSKTDTGVPIHGKIKLSGSDFTGGDSLNYLNNSILQVFFKTDNTPSSLDNITITGLKIIGSSTGGGNLVRLGGDAIPSIPDNTKFAALAATEALPIDFTNSYTETTYPDRDPITFIPNNFNTLTHSVQLIPTPKDTLDYGPSSFSGPGVNIDQLSLTGANLGNSFNITITHTDNNGCVSKNPVQYTIYDHEKAIGGLNTKYCFKNNELPAPAIAGQQIVSIAYTNNPKSYMFGMSAKIPKDPGSQIMQGAEWNAIIENLPVQLPAVDANNNPVAGFYNYTFDAAPVLNATPNPYTNFYRKTNIQKNSYYIGGKLGSVEFTAEYQDRNNIELKYPQTQLVDFYLPAIPIVELDKSNQSDLDTTDILNPLPEPTDTISINKGTPIFCVNGGLINISGYPAASAGASAGRFTLHKVAPGSPVIYDKSQSITPSGFVDNGNGTATLDPTLLSNEYADIEIVYTYKSNDSPCESSGSQIIRITPNPTAILNSTEPACQGIAVKFDGRDTNSPIAIKKWSWDFADATNSGGSNPNIRETDVLNKYDTTSHIFVQPATYDVTLVVTSAFNCKSAINSSQVIVGGIPEVHFAFEGMSTARPITFNAEASSVSDNDNFAALDWDFGDTNSQTESTSTTDVSHQYDTAGRYDVALKITSEIGCTASDTVQIVVLPNDAADNAKVYFEGFTTIGNKKGHAGWQTWSLDRTHPDAISWVWTSEKEVWTTGSNAGGAYKGLEKSALYSPEFDLSRLARPIITFFDSVNVEQSDGIVLEYSIDDKNIADPDKKWSRLGTDASGVEWYDLGNLASKPGKHDEVGDYGWSETHDKKAKDYQPAGWKQSKHSLHDIEKAELDRVVFRFALSSVASQPRFSGFTLDDIRIGNGTRTVLLENFTNTFSDDSHVPAENEAFRNFFNDSIGVEMVKMEYHVAFPGPDPFNEQNAADPAARALFYNISSIPQTRLDGGFSTEAPYFSEWGQDEFNKRILDLANAEINVDSVYVTSESIRVSGSFTTIDQLPGKTILHVAVVEEEVKAADNPELGGRISSTDVFKYVMRKMLPTAAGTGYSDLASGETKSFDYTWNNPKLFMPENDLSVIIFLQSEKEDELTHRRTIYQSFIKRKLSDPDGRVVGTDPERDEQFSVFPNPADQEITIVLPKPVAQRTAVQVYDQLGKMVNESYFEKGQGKKTITTSDYSGGVYLIQVGSEKGMLRHKVMVLHRN
jgi:hypothetical protein